MGRQNSASSLSVLDDSVFRAHLQAFHTSRAFGRINPCHHSIFPPDNGIGIPEKHRDKVFQIFKRLHARDAYGGGTGAGLCIAQKIVERHGGRIRLDSKPGEGTTFWFTLQGDAS